MSDRMQHAKKPPKVSKFPKKKDDVQCNWCGKRMKGSSMARHTEKQNHEYQSYKLKGQASVANMFHFQVVKKEEEKVVSEKEEVEREGSDPESEIQKVKSEKKEAEKEQSKKQKVEPKQIDKVTKKQKARPKV